MMIETVKDETMRVVSSVLLSLLLVACNLNSPAESNVNTPAPTKTLPSDRTQTPTDTAIVSTEEASTPNTTAPTFSTCTPQSDWDTYTVQRGDNLTSIANLTGSTVDELVAANCLENANRIRVGDTLYVPNAPQVDLPPTLIVDGDTTTYTDNAGFAFDYPSDWQLEFYTGGLGGGAVSTNGINNVPANPDDWTNDMVMVSFVPHPVEIAGNDFDAWVQDQFQQLSNNPDAPVTFGPSPLTLQSGLSGFRIDTDGPGSLTRWYYFNVDGQFLNLAVLNNFSLGVPVVQSLRSAP